MKSEYFPQNLFTDDSTNRDYFPIQQSVCIAGLTRDGEVGTKVL
jgi:hypothetical protein